MYFWTLAYLCFGNTFASGATNGEHNPITPNVEIQNRISEAVNVAVESQGSAASFTKLQKLQEIADSNPQEVLRQFLYYMSTVQGRHEEPLVAQKLMSMLDIKDKDYVSVSIIYVDSDNERLRRYAVNNLLYVERNAQVDADRFRNFIIWDVKKDEPPKRIVLYMYERSPGIAMLQLAQFNASDQEFKKATWTEHNVSDVIWKRKYGFPIQAEQMQSVRADLKGLSESPAWSIRAYAAAITKMHPELAVPGLVEGLKADKSEIVRKLATE